MPVLRGPRPPKLTLPARKRGPTGTDGWFLCMAVGGAGGRNRRSVVKILSEVALRVPQGDPDPAERDERVEGNRRRWLLRSCILLLDTSSYGILACPQPTC
jgi:hypothetical protein